MIGYDTVMMPLSSDIIDLFLLYLEQCLVSIVSVPRLASVMLNRGE
jgi:hypothetical protein